VTIDLQARRAQLLLQRDQVIAQANFVAGQLALIDELLAPEPAPVEPKEPPQG
jgi:hypothetical protein